MMIVCYFVRIHIQRKLVDSEDTKNVLSESPDLLFIASSIGCNLIYANFLVHFDYINDIFPVLAEVHVSLEIVHCNLLSGFFNCDRSWKAPRILATNPNRLPSVFYDIFRFVEAEN